MDYKKNTLVSITLFLAFVPGTSAVAASAPIQHPNRMVYFVNPNPAFEAIGFNLNCYPSNEPQGKTWYQLVFETPGVREVIVHVFKKPSGPGLDFVHAQEGQQFALPPLTTYKIIPEDLSAYLTCLNALYNNPRSEYHPEYQGAYTQDPYVAHDYYAAQQAAYQSYYYSVQPAPIGNLKRRINTLEKAIRQEKCSKEELVRKVAQLEALVEQLKIYTPAKGQPTIPETIRESPAYARAFPALGNAPAASSTSEIEKPGKPSFAQLAKELPPILLEKIKPSSPEDTKERVGSNDYYDDEPDWDTRGHLDALPRELTLVEKSVLPPTEEREPYQPGPSKRNLKKKKKKQATDELAFDAATALAAQAEAPALATLREEAPSSTISKAELLRIQKIQRSGTTSSSVVGKKDRSQASPEWLAPMTLPSPAAAAFPAKEAPQAPVDNQFYEPLHALITESETIYKKSRADDRKRRSQGTKDTSETGYIEGEILRSKLKTIMKSITTVAEVKKFITALALHKDCDIYSVIDRNCEDIQYDKELKLDPVLWFYWALLPIPKNNLAKKWPSLSETFDLFNAKVNKTYDALKDTSHATPIVRRMISYYLQDAQTFDDLFFVATKIKGDSNVTIYWNAFLDARKNLCFELTHEQTGQIAKIFEPKIKRIYNSVMTRPENYSEAEQIRMKIILKQLEMMCERGASQS